MRSPQEILERLKEIKYPGMSRDIVSFGMIKDIEVGDHSVCVYLAITSRDPGIAQQITTLVKGAVAEFTGCANVEAKVTGPAPMPRETWIERPSMKGIRHVIAVGSGKGGVGKSTASVNLAVAMRQAGSRVGLMDADVYGPTIPAMLGGQYHSQSEGEMLLPLERHSIKIMSMGLLSKEDTPVIWRGPMATKLIQQFLMGVKWGELDYLIIDMPPGTGDVQLTLTQTAPITGALIITTPQDVALNIARKGLRMFEQVKVPVLGIIENMSYFECPHCHEKTHVFRSGGARRAAAEVGVALLGQVPLEAEIVEGGDEGMPIVVKNPDSAASRVYREIAKKIMDELQSGDLARFHPVDVKRLDGTELAILWSDGHNSVYSNQHLRLNCPCATCVDEWTRERRVQPGQIRPDVQPLDFHPVGRYAIAFRWSDGHSTGIYTFDHLRALCQCPRCVS